MTPTPAGIDDEPALGVLRDRQLKLIRALHTSTPLPALMGGFAEDALLYGGSSREHNDIDFLVDPRASGGCWISFGGSGSTTG